MYSEHVWEKKTGLVFLPNLSALICIRAMNVPMDAKGQPLAFHWMTLFFVGGWLFSLFLLIGRQTWPHRCQHFSFGTGHHHRHSDRPEISYRADPSLDRVWAWFTLSMDRNSFPLSIISDVWRAISFAFVLTGPHSNSYHLSLPATVHTTTTTIIILVKRCRRRNRRTWR